MTAQTSNANSQVEDTAAIALCEADAASAIFGLHGFAFGRSKQ